MKLYLVQHGEACTKEENPDRPLTRKGKEDIARLAAFIGNAGIEVGRVIHSGKLRAQQTAEILCQCMAPGVELETSSQINPNDPPRIFDWQSGEQDMDRLVVGHLPFLARLVSLLLIENDERILVAFSPGSMVCLDLDSGGQGLIRWMLRPELL